MSNILRRPIVWFFLAVAAFVVLYTPIDAGFVVREPFCDFGSSPDWTGTILNLKHLVFYGLLALLAFLALKGQPIWVPAVIVLAITGFAELEQSVFTSGHCRLRDMVPNILALFLGGLAAHVWWNWRSHV